MAEEPRVFTVGPWGYRILEPALIGSLLPPRFIVPGFEWMARGALVAASGLLLLYLRIRGATRRASLLAALGMMLTPSVSGVFDNPFLVEPFALALLLVALITIEAETSPWLIALSLMLLALTKEIWAVLLPLIFIRGLPAGARAAGQRTLRVAGPTIGLQLLLHWMWAPQPVTDKPWPDLFAGLAAITSSLPVFAPDFLIGGLSAFALLALLRPGARAYLAEHALSLLPLLVLPLFAAAYTGEGVASSFFADDVERLLLYTIPFLAAMAVQLDPGKIEPMVFRGRLGAGRAAMVAAAVLMLAPLALDPYSRVDLSTSRDGPYVLGFARESLKTARRLARGETVVFDPEQRKFAWGVSPRTELAKLRFFLRDGFGPVAHYGIHDIRIRESKATLILPMLQPRAIRLTLTMDARESVWIAAVAGTSHLGEVLIGPAAVQATFHLPADSLFRGDNPIGLLCEKAGVAAPRILRIELSPADAPP